VLTRPAGADAALCRALVENSPDPIGVLDERCVVRFVSGAAEQLLGYEPGEWIDRSALELVHDDDVARVREAFMAVRQSTGPVTCEFRMRHQDRSWRHIEIRGVARITDARINGIVVTYRDVSERAGPGARATTTQHEAEERLRESEARYRWFAQNAAWGICSATADGRILDANPAFAAMLGYDTVADFPAVDMKDVYLPPPLRAALAAFHLNEGGTRSDEVTWRRKDGTPIVVRLTARLAADGGAARAGTAAHFECLAEDITEKRALEEQLRQAQKMEALGRLARGIAHDFNNVLAAILGCSDLMQYRLKPGDPTLEDAMEITKAAERGAVLTQRLLAFSRRQAADAQVLDTHAVVRGVDPVLQRLRGTVEVRLHTPGPAPLVRIEPGQIEQVVLNLVVNARDATPDGGSIDVVVEAVDLDPLRYPWMPHGRYARIRVKDTGVGMDTDVQGRVFEPFFTTKPPEKGIGLGLSIVYSIAKEAGGAASFTSAPGKGTTFEVLFPLASS
jgi:PAS domain S-box-containing protein